MAGQNRYTERLRLAMKGRNATGHEVTIRQLSQGTGYSFEHIRKVVNDRESCGSRQFNDAVSHYLGLDPDEMWELAQREKLIAKHGNLLNELPVDDRLSEVWGKLTELDRERIIKIAQGYAIANEAIQAENPIRIRRRREEAS